jgi:hypothetical protein
MQRYLLPILFTREEVNMEGKNRWGIWGGVILIGLGLVFLLGSIFRINIWGFLWPFIILAAGAMFFAGMAAGGRSTGALAIPGSIITTIGLILLVQNIFGIWATWSYAWGLIISGVGVGLLIFSSWSGIPELRYVGRIVIMVGLALFFIFGIFFELGAALLGMRSPGGLFWPVLLILAGLYVLVGRPLLQRYGGAFGRSEVQIFASSGAGFTPVSLEGGSAASGQLGAVRKVSFRALGDLTIVLGDREGLEIEASQAMRERIRAEVRDDTLVIRLDDEWWSWIIPINWGSNPVHYQLYLRGLESLNASGLGNVSVAELSGDHLDLTQSGAGNIQVRRLNVERLSAHQSGLGNIDVEGRAASQEISLSGAGNYEGAHLESKTARVRLSGLGTAHLWVTEELDASISGAGNVEYYGTPRVGQRVSGLGNVHGLGCR